MTHTTIKPATPNRLPHTLSEPRKALSVHLRAMCTPSELDWLIKERDILMAERAELVAALRDVCAVPMADFADCPLGKARALLARLDAKGAE